MATLIREGLLSAACVLAACGDGLADRDYQGDPLLTVRGNVKGASDVLPLEEPLLRLSAFWSPHGPRIKSVAELVEQPSITAQSSVPFSFTLKVFDTPQAQHYTNLPGGSRFALGTLLGYYDRNRNLRRDSDEPILANAHSILLYLPQNLSENLSPGSKALAAGYYQAAAALACPPELGGVPLPPDPVIAGSDCSATLGQACSSNGDCGRGVCVRELLAPWPGGGCVLPDPLPAGCGSTGITRITWAAEAEAGKPASPPVTYWVKRCSTDRDCGRSFPYQCDVAYGACLPTQLVLMNLSDSLPAPQFCR